MHPTSITTKNLPNLLHGLFVRFGNHPRGFSRKIFTVVNFDRSLESLNRQAQNIAKNKTNYSPLVKVKGVSRSTSAPAPTKSEVEEFYKKIAEETRQNHRLAKAFRDLLETTRNPEVKGVAIVAEIDKIKDQAINSFTSLLLFSSLLKKIGREAFFDEQKKVSHSIIDSGFRQELRPHQDSHIDPKTNAARIIEHQALISGFSNSQMTTYIIESSHIFDELRNKGMLEILKKESFIIEFDDESRLQNHFLVKTDENRQEYFDGYVAAAKFIPETQDEEKREKMLEAVKFIEDYTKSSPYKTEFVLNNSGTQILIFNNKHCLHGRAAYLASASDTSQPNQEVRNIFGIMLKDSSENQENSR